MNKYKLISICVASTLAVMLMRWLLLNNRIDGIAFLLSLPLISLVIGVLHAFLWPDKHDI